MAPITVRVFVSSTWLDLQPERAAVEALLQRFRETKFVGMEYFGSRDETTREASLVEVNRSDLYVGIIGGRYGSGITEAEYVRARERALPCLIYCKQESAISSEGRVAEPQDHEQLTKFKNTLRDPAHGHTVTEFSGCYELASRIAADLHNWLFDRYYGPALNDAARGTLQAEHATAVGEDLERMAATDRDLLARILSQFRIALGAFHRLTYVVPQALQRFPGTAPMREDLVRANLEQLEELLQVSEGEPTVLRELATNYRLLAAILMERQELPQALSAFRQSAVHSASLLAMRPGEALYHRDLAVSHYNAGAILEQQGDTDAARAEFLESVPSAERAAELDPQWSSLALDAKSKASEQPVDPSTLRRGPRRRRQ